jgi:hypothetical protein
MLLARIYEAFPLVCPVCRAEMRLIAFLTDRASITRILKHLGERAHAPPTRIPRARAAGVGGDIRPDPGLRPDRPGARARVRVRPAGDVVGAGDRVLQGDLRRRQRPANQTSPSVPPASCTPAARLCRPPPSISAPVGGHLTASGGLLTRGGVPRADLTAPASCPPTSPRGVETPILADDKRLLDATPLAVPR